MRIAFFSPMPPARSGIADYSAALLGELKPLAEVTVFDHKPASFDASAFDAILYQLGNNPFHVFAYEMALEHPGIVVLHEANLHHLIADLYIRRGDWDAYLREVEHDGGPEALEYARRYVRTLERGPDYDGVAMLRRVLERSRGVIVHSNRVAKDVRQAGFQGPVGRIWHGAWLVSPDRHAYREKLGVAESDPLIGIFGFLKPYKRIAESLRAFRRLLRVEPRARMLLCGEVHPELPLESMVKALELSSHVRAIGFASPEDFDGYIAACDIVLNLRYPTVGESSGTLLRALGMGRAVVVSNIGSFAEYPDTVCLKAPVDATEEDTLFEYLSLLAANPPVARSLGERARAWVKSECSWKIAAERYIAFLQSVREGRGAESAVIEPPPEPEPAPPAPAEPPKVEPEYILGWVRDAGGKQYARQHLTRLEKTLSLVPPGTPEERILEMGAYLQITPALHTRLGYGEVRGCYYGTLGESHRKAVTAESGEAFECVVDLFDAERDRYPYPDAHFATVVCGELIEHLFADPVHLMSEVNRILRPGGHLVLTTPNITSLRALSGILQGFHPMLFPAYLRPRADGETDARHNREYTPREMQALFESSGFEVVKLETGPFQEAPCPELAWVEHLLQRYMLTTEHRGDGIYILGRKSGPVRERYPGWLYS
ncbi:MAG: glycosyltransferase [Bryobacteraceae bacterium]|nr:glycosyltransferase [Bryobacteraceae bacterium]